MASSTVTGSPLSDGTMRSLAGAVCSRTSVGLPAGLTLLIALTDVVLHRRGACDVETGRPPARYARVVSIA